MMIVVYVGLGYGFHDEHYNISIIITINCRNNYSVTYI